MRKTVISTLLAATFAVGAHAAEADLSNVTIATIGTIGTGFGQHLAGNFEVTFNAPAVLPTGLICDATYFTTKRVNDPDRLMFTMLREAKEQKLKVNVRLSDAVGLAAYPQPPLSSQSRRCSIIAVGYAPQ